MLLCAACTYTKAQVPQSTIIKQTAVPIVRTFVASVAIAGGAANSGNANEETFTATIHSAGTGTVQYKWVRTCSNCSTPSPSGGLTSVPPAITTGTLTLSGTGTDTVSITVGKPRSLMHIIFENRYAQPGQFKYHIVLVTTPNKK